MTDLLNARVLIIDDRESIRTMLAHHLRRHRFFISTATSAMQAEELARKKRFDLIVVADELAHASTSSLCIRLRQIEALATIPMIMIASAAAHDVGIAALPDGTVTEIIHLPLMPGVIISKILAIYRQYRSSNVNKILVFEDLKMHLGSLMVTKNGRSIKLSIPEFKVLQCLMENPNSIVSRETLLAFVRSHVRSISANSINMYIHRLRVLLQEEEVNPNAPLPSLIITVRYQGYCLRQNRAVLKFPAYKQRQEEEGGLR